MTYDVIVVGAGPAGTIAAHECAKMGFNTILLEKFTLPREKPCGGAVMYRAIKILQGRIPRNIVERKIFGLRFLLPDGKGAEFVSDKLIGITVFRDRFDEYLTNRAIKAGVEFHEDARVVNASVSSKAATVKLADGRAFKGSFILGADGVNSIVSRSLGLRPPRKNLLTVGLGMEADFHVGEEGVLEATDGNPSVLEICPVEDRISYGWVFPKKEHLSIGIAGAAVHMRSLRSTFDEFCKKSEERLGVPLHLENRRTFFLGGDGLRSKNITKRAILIGDAAGFVDPLMGEGIAYAMKSGACAASVISNAINENRHDEEILSKYQKKCHEYFSASFGFAGQVGVYGAPLAEIILPRMNGHKLASDIMAMVARGEIGYSDIPYTVIRKLPRELPAILKHIIQSRVTTSN